MTSTFKSFFMVESSAQREAVMAVSAKSVRLAIQYESTPSALTNLNWLN